MQEADLFRALADPSAVDALGRSYAMTGSLESAIALFEPSLGMIVTVGSVPGWRHGVAAG